MGSELLRTESWGDIGFLKHYGNRKFGKARWMCTCGHEIVIRMEQKLYVRKDNEPVEVQITHRYRSRVYRSHDPEGYEILSRLDKVASYANCVLPWRDYN